MIKGTPQRFAIDGDDLPAERRAKRLRPVHTALGQFVGLEPR
jgi:hypothetical protein